MYKFISILTFFFLVTVSCSEDEGAKKENEGPTEEPSPDATHFVGPDRDVKKLQDIANQLQPGDVVDVDGDFEYQGGIVFSKNGTAADPIIIRGKMVNGKRPVIKRGPNERIIVMNGAHTIFEGFEVVGEADETTKAGIGVYANNIKIRNCVIHDCRNGILGYGSDTGSVLVEFCEIYNCGGEANGDFDFAHQIYMATDEVAFPNAVFRLQHCYIHDAKGGNNVKSRSGRNEIYYNWIEGARYHAIELIGPDLDDNDNMEEDTKREDSDVVGNVIIATSNGSGARIGGDGTGQTHGRYRFVNNTFIMKNNADGLRGLDAIETVELYNNIFYKGAVAGADVFSEADVEWEGGSRQVKGSNNYVQPGLSKVPAGLTGSLTNASPGFTDEAQFNYVLKADSPLKTKGTLNPATITGAAFPSPLFPPAFLPPARKHDTLFDLIDRSVTPSIDVGAF